MTGSRLLLALAAVTCVALGIARAADAIESETIVTTIPIAGSTFSSCTGELVAFQGTMHRRTT